MRGGETSAEFWSYKERAGLELSEVIRGTESKKYFSVQVDLYVNKRLKVYKITFQVA